MQTLNNAKAGDIVLTMAERIVENRAYLSEIDGKIGDGEHCVNMAKGFNMAAERLQGKNETLAASLDTLGLPVLRQAGVGRMQTKTLYCKATRQIEGKSHGDQCEQDGATGKNNRR